MKPASAFLSLAALSWPAMAAAQQAVTDTQAGSGAIEEVVVTGFRGSLASALEEKRAQSGVVDVIKAEDIAKFPDANLAESLQRLPGVAVARDGGEGRSISVRGLGPDYTRVRLNGLESQTTSNGFEGINRTRGFDFNVFASELFSSLTVRKTPSSETEEGSLGATVDLQTGRPFDTPGTQFAVSTKVSYNDLSEDNDPRFAMLASKTFHDDTLGVLLSAAYSESHKISQASHNLNWDRMTENGGWCDPANAAGVCFNEYPTGITYQQLRASTIYHPRIPRLAQFGVDNERLGITGALQWKPAESTTMTLDLLYSRHDGLRTENLLTPIGIFRAQSQQGKPETIVRDAEVRDNDLVYARLDNVDLRAELSIFDFSTEFRQAGFSVVYDNDRWRGNLQVGYSDSQFDEPRETTLQVDRLNTDGFIYDFRDSMTRPRIVWGFDTTDPANYYYGPAVPGFTGGATGPEIRLRPQAVHNTFGQAAFDVGYSLTDSWQLKTGINARKYTFDSDAQRLTNERNIPPLPAGVTVADLVQPFSGFDGFGVPAETATAWVVPVEQSYIDIFDIYGNTGTFTLRRDVPSARSSIYSIDEKDYAGFLQAEFDVSLFGRETRGDLGVRYVRTEQEAVGFAEAGANTQQLHTSRTYGDWLPAFNAVMDLTDEVMLRLAASRVMTRPPLAQLTPGGAVNVAGGTRTVTQGNPNLEPIKADAFDAGVEWYFAPESLVSLSVFYKDVKTYIATLRTTQPFNTLGIPPSVLIGTGVLPTDDFIYSRPVNSDGGPLEGFEFNLQMPLTFLPGFLRDFGLLANYTHTSSDITYIVNPALPEGTAGRTAVLPLINLSKETANATLYYAKAGFEGRVSASYRDDYLRIVPGLNGQDADATKGSTYIDATLSYAFNDNFQLSFEAQNLTDTFEHLYNDTTAQRNEYFRNFGRQYTLGLRFSY